MPDYDYLDGFRSHDGNTSWAGQQNAGLYEQQNGLTPAPQRWWEGASAFQQRISYSWSSNDGSS